MGWFGYGIMDGDEPYNALNDILSVIGYIETNGVKWDEPFDGMRFLIETRFQKIVDYICKVPGSKQRLYWQVFAALAMEQGSRITPGAKASMLKALDEDDMFENNLARIIYVREMSQTLRQYEGGVPTRMYGDWKKKYGLSDTDLDNPAKSAKMLEFLMREMAEHLKSKAWFRGVQFAVNREGYVILVVVDEDHVEKDAHSILNDKEVPGNLFDMPVMFSITNQKTVRCAGDSIFD